MSAVLKQNEVVEAEDEILMYGEKEARWYQIAALHEVEAELHKGTMRIRIVEIKQLGSSAIWAVP